ncbi:MAG: hypothetical protein E6Q97_36960 [Desulfurellales bacterium]|nr:MAG: hypothetical protein E6Q97_36960 [Desulfurellales bacterium]
MKMPPGYEKIHARRVPILAEMKRLQAELDAIDAPYIDGMTREFQRKNYFDAESASRNQMNKLHKKFDPK